MFTKIVTKVKYYAILAKMALSVATMSSKRMEAAVIPTITPAGYPVKSLDHVFSRNQLLAMAFGELSAEHQGVGIESNTIYFTSGMVCLSEELTKATMLHEEGHILGKLFPGCGMSVTEFEVAADAYMIKRATVVELLHFTAYLELNSNHFLKSGDWENFFQVEARITALKSHLGL